MGVCSTKCDVPKRETAGGYCRCVKGLAGPDHLGLSEAAGGQSTRNMLSSAWKEDPQVGKGAKE